MASAEEVWLAALQRIVGRAAHEVKGALNGVAVNLEVARSRSERDDAAPASIRPYAAAASSQLASVIDLNEALLALARAGREPADVGAICRQLAALLGPAARTRGGDLTLHIDPATQSTTRATAVAVRATLGTALVDACQRSDRVECRCAPGPTGVIVTMEPANADALTGLSCLREAGIEIATAGHGISILFP